MRALAVLLLAVIAACDAVPGRVFTSSSSPAVMAATQSASTSATATARPTSAPSPTPRPIADVLAQIDPAKLDDHMRALASFQSRHPLHPGHAKAVAYLMEQLSAIPGLVVQDIPPPTTASGSTTSSRPSLRRGRARMASSTFRG